MAKVLVTGATGFVGNYVIHRLLQSGNEIIATSSNKEKAATYDWFPEVTWLPLDLKDLDQSINYFSFFQHPSHCIHLAWEGLPFYKETFHLEENLPRHKVFLKNLISNGLKDLTVAGTCLEYGMQEGCLKEDLPAEPLISYPVAKNQLRQFLEELQLNNQFILKWVRLFYMYGKGQNPNSLFSQLEKALASGSNVFNMSGGEQVRDYLPVGDVADIVCRIALQKEVTGIINCCSGNPVTVRKMVEDYLKNNHQSISLNLGYYPYSDYEPMFFWGNTSKLALIK